VPARKMRTAISLRLAAISLWNVRMEGALEEGAEGSLEGIASWKGRRD